MDVALAVHIANWSRTYWKIRMLGTYWKINV